MKAAAFAYVRPRDTAEAIGLLVRHGAGAKLLAGGQSLLPALNLRLSAPDLLIDIGRIAALRGIGLADRVLRLGALTTHADLLSDPLVRAHAPLLAEAVAHVAHPAIRARGTLGGSLANADPAAELPACVLALGARLVAEGPGGLRRIPADAFFTGLFATALAPDEILTAIEVDAANPADRHGFAELARREGDYALAGLAASGTLGPAGFTTLRLAYFAVGTVPTLARHAATCLIGRAPDAAALEAAAEALAQDLEPHDDLQASAATRLHLARVLLRRVVPTMTPLPQAA